MLEDDFGFQLIKINLGMYLVVVVVAGGCRGDLGFGILFLFVFWDIIFYWVDILF